MGSQLYEPSDPRGEHRVLNDAVFALDHFPAKLLSLTDGFRTDAGRLLAVNRHQALGHFYHGLLHEVST